MNSALSEIFKRNKEMSLVIKCVIIKPDGSEEWIKKEGEDLNDYEVLDKLINRNFEDIYVVPL
jgi:hypothetical protein